MEASVGWFLKVVQLLARAKLALTITSLIGCLGSWSYRQRRKVRSFEERILNRFGALSFDAAKENNKLILKFITSSLIYYGRADLRGESARACSGSPFKMREPTRYSRIQP